MNLSSGHRYFILNETLYGLILKKDSTSRMNNLN